MGTLRATAPWRVLEGFGRAVRAACLYAAPRSYDELLELLARARAEGLPVTFRGAGRSYGDASLNTDQLVIDTTQLQRILSWDKESGTLEAESGLSIEGVWRHTLPDGFWPAVVPGTMRPTLAGCLSMNVHGKNNYRAGPFGEHVLGFDLVTSAGERLQCSPAHNEDIFYAAQGGLGMLGAITRVKLRLKRIHSGNLRVSSLSAPSLDGLFSCFEEQLIASDYAVGWVDCTARGAGLGRGVLHAARYLAPGEDRNPEETLRLDRQDLPPRILGVPKRHLWRLMRPFTNNPGVSLVNTARYFSSWRAHRSEYLQSHAAFAFLLDYVPDWRLIYGPGGFIQYQAFVPNEAARDCFRDLLRLSQQAGLPSYLGVLKRHRPDAFLLSHAVDGWSLALDFRVTPGTEARLWTLCEQMTERVLTAGGRFYFAKDARLSPASVARSLGNERLERFFALKRRLDPGHTFSSDLWRRTMAPNDTARP